MEFPRYSSALGTNTALAPTHPTETSISLSTFRNLPIEVQRDYARFHALRDARKLSTDEICDSLFKGTEWLEAKNIEDPNAIVVDGNVMDLVDWHIEHRDHATSLNRLPSPEDTLVEPASGPSVVRPTSDARVNQDHNTDIRLHHLQRMSEDLHRANIRIKAAIKESRNAASDICAEVFLLQHKLDTEKTYQSSVSTTMAGIFAAEAMVGIEEQVGMAENAGRLDGTGKKRRRSSSPYHVVTADGSLQVKRRRIGDVQSQGSTVPRTILNYQSDNDDFDDTYSDSNGTDGDFVDDPYSFLDSRGRTPFGELDSWNWTRESSDEESTETSMSQKNIPWASIDDFDDDSSDSDYQPPEWDLEDIWGIEHPHEDKEIGRMNPLHLDNFGDELNDCGGFLSHAGLSTDDPDDGYHDPAIVQRPSRGTFVNRKEAFSKSLGPLLTYINYSDPNIIGWGLNDEQREAAKQRMIRDDKLTLWDNVKVRLQYNLFSPLDLRQRLADLLESNHHHFYFDDVEWRRFEDH